MYEIDFKKPLHVHFMGIGGISMSGLAEILLKEDFTISGSDTKPSALTEHLVSLGATIFYPQKASNIIDGIDVVVYTAAIRETNEEYIEAKRKNIPMLTRAELLGQLMKNYGTPIAVSGTHGKTTTTSMLSHILLAAKKDPTISVGGILHAIGGNIRVGNSDVFVTEACEYTNSFLEFFPKISIVLNVEEDHMDFFKDIDDIRNSFHNFAKLLPEDGALIINKDIEKMESISDGLSCRVITYSDTQDADYSAQNIAFDAMGNASFDLIKYGSFVRRITLSVAGTHNVSNALSTIAVADLLEIPFEVAQEGLLSFTGTDSQSLMIMRIIQQRLKQHSLPCRIILTAKCGASSNHILIQEQKPSSTNSQKRFHWQTTSFLQISTLQEKQIHWECLRKLLLKK